jgi:hypothetical protein
MIYFKPSAIAAVSEELHISPNNEPSTPSRYASHILYISISYGCSILALYARSIQVESRLGHCYPNLVYSCVSLVSLKKNYLQIGHGRLVCYFNRLAVHNNLRLINNRFEITVGLCIYRASFLKEKNFWLAFGRRSFRISAGTPTFLTEVIRILQPLQPNAKTAPKIRTRRVPSRFFPIIWRSKVWDIDRIIQ